MASVEGSWMLREKSVSEFSLNPGSKADRLEIEKIAFRDQKPAARSDAERYLAGSEHTVRQLEAYLLRRRYIDDVIEEILSWAKRCGLVDDRRYATEFVRSHSEQSPMGNYRMRIELRKRGVSEQITDDILTLREESDLRESLVKKVYEKYGRLDREKGMRRAAGYLQRRGFQHDLIRGILTEVFRRKDEV